MRELDLASYGYKELVPFDFYNEIYNLDNNAQLQDSNEELVRGTYKTNPIALAFKGDQVYKYIMFKDKFNKTLKDIQKYDFSIMSGLTYFGRHNRLDNANKCYCLIFDLDDVSQKELDNFMHAMSHDVYPEPSYLVRSGTGLHLYYVFEEPISLYPETKKQLKQLKHDLTDLIWNKYTSQSEVKQFQGINQGFRIVGSNTKNNKSVKAYKRNDKRTTLEELNNFLHEPIDFSNVYKETKITLEEAKVKFPEWYEHVIINKGKSGTWTTKRDLYVWWKKNIMRGATYGHRYFCIMTLAIYAIKANIPFEELQKDAYELMPYFGQLSKEDPFTKADVDSALECYDVNYRTFPIDDISKLTGITIKKNKRNFMKQKDHLKVARAIQNVKLEISGKETWRNLEGRPKGSGTKEHIIKEFREKYPNKTKAECNRETGVSRPTINKYWD